MRLLAVIGLFMLLLPTIGRSLVESASTPPAPVNSAAGQSAGILGALLIFLALAALGIALRGTTKWLLGFHRTMRKDGLW